MNTTGGLPDPPQRRRVGLCGGTQLEPATARFCEALGAELAKDDCLQLVTGGFKHLAARPDTPSSDWSFVRGAEAYLASPQNEGAGASFETMLPDLRFESNDVVRFERGAVRRLTGRSLQARRFQLVRSVDALVSTAGRAGTRGMIELAFALDVPVLPLPFTGGESCVLWRENRDVICAWFGISTATARDWERVDLAQLTVTDLQCLAAKVVVHLRRQLRRHCLVIMPFESTYDRLYLQAIEPAIRSVRLEPFRLDRLHLVGNVVDALRAAARTCVAGVAILTGSNPNVTYEIGLLHAQGKPVVLACRIDPKTRRLPTLPYDLQVESVIGYANSNLRALREEIKASLAQRFGKPAGRACMSRGKGSCLESTSRRCTLREAARRRRR